MTFWLGNQNVITSYQFFAQQQQPKSQFTICFQISFQVATMVIKRNCKKTSFFFFFTFHFDFILIVSKKVTRKVSFLSVRQRSSYSIGSNQLSAFAIVLKYTHTHTHTLTIRFSLKIFLLVKCKNKYKFILERVMSLISAEKIDLIRLPT